MKRIKTKDIEHSKLITKAEYARKIGISQAGVQKQIDTGKLVVVQVRGAELIHE